MIHVVSLGAASSGPFVAAIFLSWPRGASCAAKKIKSRRRRSYRWKKRRKRRWKRKNEMLGCWLGLRRRVQGPERCVRESRREGRGSEKDESKKKTKGKKKRVSNPGNIHFGCKGEKRVREGTREAGGGNTLVRRGREARRPSNN